MRNKIIIFISVIRGFILILIIAIILKNKTNQDINKITFSNCQYTRREIFDLLVKKNSDWSKLPLTKLFLSKFNEKDGILGKIQYDKVEWEPYLESGKYPFDEFAHIVVTQGLKKTAYTNALKTKADSIIY